MSVEVVRGGQRRIDRVLDPGFVAGVGQLDLAELHARREEAEEADISFLRRLLQGRLDILRAELDVEVLTREEESVSGHRRRCNGWWTCSAASWPAVTATGAPRSPSFSSELLDLVEGLKFPTVRSERDRAGPIAPLRPARAAHDTDGDPDGGEPRAGGRRRPGHPAGRLRAARPGRVRAAGGPDGLAALDVVRSERPDLVILDRTMPRLDGLRACQALRSDPELAGTRVLVLTGRDQPDDRVAARDADAYLVKPFSSLQLLEAVRRLVDA
jgi:CheY-like chemotaxis protein